MIVPAAGTNLMPLLVSAVTRTPLIRRESAPFVLEIVLTSKVVVIVGSFILPTNTRPDSAVAAELGVESLRSIWFELAWFDILPKPVSEATLFANADVIAKPRKA